MTMESNTPLNLGTVYPLYYGTHYQSRESQLGSWVPEEPHSNTIYVGTPIRTSTSEPAKIGVLQNLFANKNYENTFKRLCTRHPREATGERMCFIFEVRSIFSLMYELDQCVKKKKKIILFY